MSFPDFTPMIVSRVLFFIVLRNLFTVLGHWGVPVVSVEAEKDEEESKNLDPLLYEKIFGSELDITGATKVKNIFFFHFFFYSVYSCLLSLELVSNF